MTVQRLPQITTGDGRPLKPPIAVLASVTPARACSERAALRRQRSHGSELSIPRALPTQKLASSSTSLCRVVCPPPPPRAQLGAPPRSKALSSQHVPEVCNAAALVLGMLVLPLLQGHLLLLRLGHLLCLWLLLNVSHSALLRDVSV